MSRCRVCGYLMAGPWPLCADHMNPRQAGKVMSSLGASAGGRAKARNMRPRMAAKARRFLLDRFGDAPFCDGLTDFDALELFRTYDTSPDRAVRAAANVKRLRADAREWHQ